MDVVPKEMRESYGYDLHDHSFCYEHNPSKPIPQANTNDINVISVRWVAGRASANGATGANSRTTSSPKVTAIRSGRPSTRRPATWVTVPNGTPLNGARYTEKKKNHQPIHTRQIQKEKNTNFSIIKKSRKKKTKQRQKLNDFCHANLSRSCWLVLFSIWMNRYRSRAIYLFLRTWLSRFSLSVSPVCRLVFALLVMLSVSVIPISSFLAITAVSFVSLFPVSLSLFCPISVSTADFQVLSLLLPDSGFRVLKIADSYILT